MWDYSAVSEKENRSSLFLGMDQHARQLTVSLHDQNGDMLLAREVPVQPETILDFFDQLTRCCAQRQEPFIAVLEVCGFNDWLIEILRNYRCHKVILVQPEERKRCKTDRRDDRSARQAWLIHSPGLSTWTGPLPIFDLFNNRQQNTFVEPRAFERKAA